METEKIIGLKQNLGNFSAKVKISSLAKKHLQWWIEHAQSDSCHITRTNATLTQQTDASLLGWGATLLGNDSTGGRWADSDKFQHINFLELKAAFFGLKALCSDVKQENILLQMDNTTAITYINNMGGSHSIVCNNLAREIWCWCLSREIWLIATHIAGVKNITADRESRNFDDRTEWKLNENVFRNITRRWGTPDIDLFASRLNFQIKPFVSWKADPEATAINAFTISWSETFSYIFPPFSLLGKVLQKLQEDKGKAIVIVPEWKTQTWYPMLQKLMLDQPIQLPQRKSLLLLPFNMEKTHPLLPKMRMQAWLLSGNPLDKKLSGRAIQIIQSSWRPSTMCQYSVYILKWLKFAEQHAFQTYNPTINQIIEFLTCLFDEGCDYSALNTARSALGTSFN